MERDLYSIEEARERLGGIARNTIYELLRSGELGSVLIKRRRFISAAAIAAYIAVTESTDPPNARKPALDQVVQMRLGLRPAAARPRTGRPGR
jgi:excisionase family DNA binding protein